MIERKKNNLFSYFLDLQEGVATLDLQSRTDKADKNFERRNEKSMRRQILKLSLINVKTVGIKNNQELVYLMKIKIIGIYFW